MTPHQIVIIMYAAYLGLISVVSFFLYLIDKKKAERGSYRIPEKVLLLFSFFGGAFLAYPAMLIFRHKTRGEHWYFTFVNLLGIAIHAALFILLVFYFKF